MKIDARNLWLLTILQAVLAATLICGVPWWQSIIALVACLPGAVLAVAAWIRMGVRRIRVTPSDDPDGDLVTDGPYAVDRHPMYTGLLWFTAATLLSRPTSFRFVLWMALLGVLVGKAIIEERNLLKQFSDYADYRDRVGFLLPRFAQLRRMTRFLTSTRQDKRKPDAADSAADSHDQ